MHTFKNSILQIFSCIFLLSFIAGCTALPANSQNASLQGKEKIVEELIGHKNFIGIFKRADELYQNHPTPDQALDISGSVRAYLEANARSGPKIYALLKDNGFEAVYRDSPDKIPPTVMCKILYRCDEVVSGYKNAATLHPYVTKTYDLHIEIKNGTISQVSAHVRTH